DQPERIDQQVPLATGEPLTAVIALRAPSLGRLDRLAVDDRRRRLPWVTLGLPEVAPQLVVQPVEGAVLLPGAEVPVHAVPGREVVGQGAPLAAGAVDVEQGVDDLAPRVFGGSAARLGRRDEAL